MVFMERMKKIELVVLKRDVDTVMRYLGEAGCLQLIGEGGVQTEPTLTERETAELKVKVEAVARFLGLHIGPRERAERPTAVKPREALRAAAERLDQLDRGREALRRDLKALAD